MSDVIEAVRTEPASTSTTARSRSRLSVPRGLITGTLAATALTWGLYEIQPGASLLSARA